MRPDHSSMEWRFSRAPGTSLVCNRNDETMSFNHYPCSKTAPLHEMKTRISILHIIPVFHSLGVIEISCPIYLLISSNLPSRPTLPFPSSYSSFSYIFPLHFPPRLFFFISFFFGFLSFLLLFLSTKTRHHHFNLEEIHVQEFPQRWLKAVSPLFAYLQSYSCFNS